MGYSKSRKISFTYKDFYKDATAAILVYDITRKKSFDEIKNYWYKQLIECAPSDLLLVLQEIKQICSIESK